MRQVITLFFLMVISQNAWCWGSQGHMIVGQIGEDNLTPKAKKEVSALLEGDTMAEVANWADSIKNNPEWNHTKSWHFVDIPDGDDYTTVDHNHDGDIVSAITESVAVLKDRTASTEDKQNALKFIIHFVGDIHQPLHVGRPGDHGGNSIRVVFEGRNSNLHSLWDTGMIMKRPMTYQQYARELQAQSFLGAVYDLPEFSFSTVISEDMSFRKDIYNFSKNITEGPIVLTTAYYNRNVAMMNARLLAGGKRLAQMLNMIFK